MSVETKAESTKAAEEIKTAASAGGSVTIHRVPKGKRNDYYRVRLGGRRVIYGIINGKIVVITTLLAGSRGDAYKKMDALAYF